MSYRITIQLVGLILAFVAAPSVATAAAGPLIVFQEANAAIQTQLAQESAGPPGMSDPTYARRVEEAFNLAAIESVKDQPLQQAMAVCDQALQTVIRYGLFGVKQGELVSLDTKMAQERLSKAQNLNAGRFQDEIALGMRFNISCLAMEAPKINVFIGGLKAADMTPARRGGFVQMQGGWVDMIDGVVLGQLDPIKPRTRAMLLDTLVKYVDEIAPNLTKGTRGKIYNAIDRTLASPLPTPEVRTKLHSVKQAINQAACAAQCGIGD